MSDGVSERRDLVEGLGVGGRRILKWISRNRVGGCVLDLRDSGQRSGAGCCENGSEPSGSTKQVRAYETSGMKNLITIKFYTKP